jgi:NAD(P)-dependent dehydrogenase (short-subunit alcohol dehydrogenase family)
MHTSFYLKLGGQMKDIASKIYTLDICSEQSIENLARELKGVPIDLLINNAGIYHHDLLDTFTQKSMMEEYLTNCIGPALLSRALLSNLRLSAQPRIVNITSRMGSIADNTSGRAYGYRASKAGLNAITRSWSVDVPDVPAVALHPGYIQTRMVDFRGDLTADECADRLAAVITEFRKPVGESRWRSGDFIHRDGEILPW